MSWPGSNQFGPHELFECIQPTRLLCAPDGCQYALSKGTWHARLADSYTHDMLGSLWMELPWDESAECVRQCRRACRRLCAQERNR